MDRFLLLVGALAWVGCADPCFDDGLAQGGCPPSETQDGSSTLTASGGATIGTATWGTASMGSTTVMTETMGTATMESLSGGTVTAGTMTAATETIGGLTDGTETDASETDGAACPTLQRILTPQTPTVLLVIDQSRSMEETFSGGTSRWDAVLETLIDPDAGVVVSLQSRVRFGAFLYTSNDPPDCPVTSTSVPRLDAANDISMLLGSAMPESGTPTGESLVLATQVLLDDSWEGDKVLVLATDGEPATCDQLIPTTDAELEAARDVSVDAVDAAYDEGIRTFVVSVGDEVAEDHLQALANAGVGQPADGDATFYTALDPDALTDAFQEIIAGVRSCVIDLEAELSMDFAPSCEVTINHEPLPYEDPDGWILADNETSIELQGDSCRAIQDGVVSIEMTCTCEAGG